MFPITRPQLVQAIQSYGFTEPEAQRIVIDLEGEGRISLSGSMVKILHPTASDAEVIKAICQRARGGSSGEVGTYRLIEYLKHIRGVEHKAGRSRRT